MKLKLIPLVLTLGLGSCYHVYYAPNTANVPMLTEKGETRINALYSSGGDSQFQGAELQAAVAVTDKVGVMANFLSGARTEESYSMSTGISFREKGRGNYFEIGAGINKKLDKKGRWLGEGYFGTGFGQTINEYGFGDDSKVGISKVFLQPSVGYKSKYFEWAIAPKLSLVGWKVKENNIRKEENSSHVEDLKRIQAKKNFLVFEPALLIRAGGEGFKVQAGLSFSGRKEYYFIGGLTETLNASLGISIDIVPDKKK